MDERRASTFANLSELPSEIGGRMNLPEPLRSLPDDTTIRLGFVRECLARVDDAPEVVTIAQAVERWSYSRETWRQAAAEGELPGAWQDTEGGTWRLPAEACRRYVRARQSDGRRRGTKGPRGPRARYTTTPHLQGEGQPVVEGGPPQVRGEADGDARPSHLRLAR